MATGTLFHRVATLPAAGTLLLMPLLTGCSGPLSTLEPAGPSARAAAWLWWGMFGLFSVIMVVVIALWLYATVRKPVETDPGRMARTHTRWIVGGGLVLPVAAITLVLAFGVPLGQRMLPLPLADGEPLQIEVTAHQWWWEVHYPQQGIRLENEIHIPAGEPVDLLLTSDDVIHSFWVPQLAGKLDMFPGRTNTLRLEADRPGRFRGVCAEFCGLGHSHMAFVVTAHNDSDWQRWLTSVGAGGNGTEPGSQDVQGQAQGQAQEQEQGND